MLLLLHILGLNEFEYARTPDWQIRCGPERIRWRAESSFAIFVNLGAIGDKKAIDAWGESFKRRLDRIQVVRAHLAAWIH